MKKHEISIGLMVLMLPIVTWADRLTVGIVQDGDSWVHQMLLESVKKELDSVAGPDELFEWKASDDFNAGWNGDMVKSAIGKAIEDPLVDIVLALGPLSTREVYLSDEQFQKPVMGVYPQDPGLLNDTTKGPVDSSPGSNMNLITFSHSIDDDIHAFMRILPLERLAILIDAPVLQSMGPVLENLRARLESRYALDIRFIPMGSDAATVYDKITGNEFDGLYIFPPSLMADTEREHLVDLLIKSKVPSFAYFGEPAVRNGILAGAIPDIRKQLSRRIALNLLAVSSGTPLETLPGIIPVDNQALFYNETTANAIGLPTPISILRTAQIVGSTSEEAGMKVRLDLPDAVQLAMEGNLELSIQRTISDQVRSREGQAMSIYYPQISARSVYSRIDEERARSSMGLQPEERLTAGVVAEQLIHSSEARNSIKAAAGRTAMEESLLESKRLDITYACALAYFNYLRARALLRIAEENLSTTRKNLEFARVREKVGTTGIQDVYRLEAAEAADLSRYQEARAGENLALLHLNQTMRQPLEKDWLIINKDLESAEFRMYTLDIKPMLRSMRQIDNARKFLIEFAMDNSPEIEASRHSLDSARFLETGARRSRYLPDLTAQFTYNTVASESRIGPTILDATGNEEWSAGIVASLPLFEGGRTRELVNERKSQVRQAELAVEQAIQATETRVRAAVFQLSASSANLDFSRISAEKAADNLEIVTNQYRQGVINIVQLLDAQTQATTQRENAMLAVYQFLEDIVTLQRAIGAFSFPGDTYSHALWIEQLKQSIN